MIETQQDDSIFFKETLGTLGIVLGVIGMVAYIGWACLDTGMGSPLMGIWMFGEFFGSLLIFLAAIALLTSL